MICRTFKTPNGQVKHCGNLTTLTAFAKRVCEMWKDYRSGWRHSFGSDQHKRDHRIKEHPNKVLERYATPKKRGSYNR